MIEKIICDYLNSLDLPAPAYTEMPEEYPGKCYLIEKTGSSMLNHIDKATISIRSYGSSLYEAITLNNAVKKAMLDGLISLDEVSGVKLNSDYNFTDTTTKRYRYQAVFVVTYYEQEE